VLLNLIPNAIDALSGASEGASALQINSGIHASQGVVVMVYDRGIGLFAESFEHLFN
jgi:C4-dicarboxylate-specific signal transduction histidine kinase